MTRIMKEVTQQGADNDTLAWYLVSTIRNQVDYSRVCRRADDALWDPCDRYAIADLVKSCGLEQAAR